MPKNVTPPLMNHEDPLGNVAPQPDWFADPVWRSVLDAIPSGLVAVDGQGQVVYCNPFAELALDLSAAAAVGRHFRDVFCPSLPLDRCWVSQALNAGTPLRNHRFRLEHPAGKRFPLVADLTPIRDREHAVLGAVVTITPLETAAAPGQDPDQSDPIHGDILDSVADGFYTVDHEWRITSFNRAAERLTGLREADVLGKVCSQVLETDRCADGCPLASTLERNENLLNNDIVMRAGSDQHRPVTANTAVLADRHGTPIGGVVSFRDSGLLAQLHRDLDPAARFEGMVGDHATMRELYELVTEVADSTSSVLIMGESGTGKEMVANALVRRSRRRDSPFVKVNCSVFPDALLESELFGHVKGAFTDARRDRAGRFRLANNGTILLDEIGEISPAAQVKLLRVLEQRQFEPVGSSQTVTVDVRVIAATNRDLPRLVREGQYREDLYYRLNVIPITLPPLRERPSDIPLLVRHFIAKYRLVTEKPIDGLEQEAIDLLLGYDFPGNVRELENAIEHAFARTRGTTILAEKLPLAIRLSGTPAEAAAQAVDAGSEESGSVLEALHRARWNRDGAARILGISRTTLWRRMKALGLDGPPHTS